ncbi:MAG: acyl-CoA thioesterase [Salinirussus sp.]
MEEYAVDVRYRDVDPLRHVDHVEYVAYMQEARMAYLEEKFDMTARGLEVIVVHVEVDYESEIDLGDDVTVGVECTDPGSSSFRAVYEIRADGELAATGETVQLAADADTVEPIELPDDWRTEMA